jgi:class 3 adenylate cyclase
LATVLFTDIVGSTETAAELGDRRWKELLEEHHRRVRGQLARFRGTEVDTAGDGFFATFDGPARAVRCARAIAEAVAPLGVRIRASEVVVSQTVRDLVAGSGLSFEDAGEHELKGVPDRWRLYRVTA